MICNHPERIEKFTTNREGDGFPRVCQLDNVPIDEKKGTYEQLSKYTEKREGSTCQKNKH